MQEIWKDIEGYEGLYQVSNLGNIRSAYNKGSHKLQEKYKVIKTDLSRGYPLVRLFKDGKIKRVRVHRLVAKAFIPNPYNKPCINHIDCNKKNNHVSNLEWCSQKENVEHASRNNLLKQHKLKDSCKAKKINQLDLQGNYIRTWGCMKEITQEIGIAWQNISKCCRGLRDTAGNYKWEYSI